MLAVTDRPQIGQSGRVYRRIDRSIVVAEEDDNDVGEDLEIGNAGENQILLFSITQIV